MKWISISCLLIGWRWWLQRWRILKMDLMESHHEVWCELQSIDIGDNDSKSIMQVIHNGAEYPAWLSNREETLSLQMTCIPYAACLSSIRYHNLRLQQHITLEKEYPAGSHKGYPIKDGCALFCHDLILSMRELFWLTLTADRIGAWAQSQGMTPDQDWYDHMVNGSMSRLAWCKGVLAIFCLMFELCDGEEEVPNYSSNWASLNEQLKTDAKGHNIRPSCITGVTATLSFLLKPNRKSSMTESPKPTAFSLVNPTELLGQVTKGRDAELGVAYSMWPLEGSYICSFSRSIPI